MLINDAAARTGELPAASARCQRTCHPERYRSEPLPLGNLTTNAHTAHAATIPAAMRNALDSKPLPS